MGQVEPFPARRLSGREGWKLPFPAVSPTQSDPRRRQSPDKEHKSQTYPLGRLDPGLSPSFEVFQVLDVHQIPVGIRIEFAQGPGGHLIASCGTVIAAVDTGLSGAGE